MSREPDRRRTVEALTQEGRPGPLLIVCRDLQGVESTRRLVAKYNGRVVVASNDPRVHRAVQDSDNIQDAVFLDKLESYYCVADDVIAIMGRVNNWLGHLSHAEGIQEDLLHWAMHCEGGETSQRVLDCLLVMRSYRELVDRFRPREIIVVRSSSATWEDELLLAEAVGQKIPIRYSGGLGTGEWFRKRLWQQTVDHRCYPGCDDERDHQ